MSSIGNYLGNFLYNLFLGVTYTACGVFAGVAIVSKFVYESPEISHDYKTEEIPFEEEYKDILDEVTEYRGEIPKEELENLREKTISITSPNGDIIMYYDSENEAFHYYCDTKNLTYGTLEHVARRYVLEYDCKCLYIDMDKEMERLKMEAEEMESAKNKLEEKEKEEPTYSVFAIFKNYKTDEKKNVPKIKKQANRFKYLGKIKDSLDAEEVKKSDSQEFVNIDYASFKKKKE